MSRVLCKREEFLRQCSFSKSLWHFCQLWESYSIRLWLVCVLSCSVMSDSLGYYMACSPPGSSDHGIFQARILEWGAISSCMGSSLLKDQTHVSWVSCIGRQILHQECHLGSPVCDILQSNLDRHKRTYTIKVTTNHIFSIFKNWNKTC